jgi:thiamine-phosphate pyrophosphorylase
MLPVRSADPIPTLVVITDRAAATRADRDVATTVAAALDGGAPAILLRDRELPRQQRRLLGQRLRELTLAAGARLLISSDVGLAREVGADGVHLTASDAPLPSDADVGLVGRSCHDGVEVAAARDEAVTYAFVSPVAATATKPGYGPALGTEGVRTLVEAAGDLPLLALGGVTADNAANWRTAGASGLAVLGGVMTAADPAAAVRSLLAAWQAG